MLPREREEDDDIVPLLVVDFGFEAHKEPTFLPGMDYGIGSTWKSMFKTTTTLDYLWRPLSVCLRVFTAGIPSRTHHEHCGKARKPRMSFVDWQHSQDIARRL